MLKNSYMYISLSRQSRSTECIPFFLPTNSHLTADSIMRNSSETGEGQEARSERKKRKKDEIEKERKRVKRKVDKSSCRSFRLRHPQIPNNNERK